MRLLVSLLAAATFLCAADAKYGKPLKLKDPMSLAALMEKPDDYAGKTVQVKARITEVCQMMGCWLELADDQGHHLRFNSHDSIEFPKDSAGRSVVAEGKLLKEDVSKEEAIERAKEDAKDKGKPFDPSTVTAGPEYSIQGTGAVILSK